MPRPSASLRHQTILTELNRTGLVQVESLSKQLHTSEVTIRKDLSVLERDGLLIRRYGGAQRLPLQREQFKEHPREQSATSNSASSGLHSAEPKVSNRKFAIGQLAGQQVNDHSRILIDFGTTTTAMIPHLAHVEGLMVMTNSMRTAQAVLALTPSPTLLMTGGTWDNQTHSLQGQIAEQVLQSYDFDQLFIGCDGLDPQRGTTTFNELFGLSQVMAESAREVIVLATTDKLGRRIPNLELPWSKIDTLITDADIPKDARQQIEQQGVRVLIAACEGAY
ncbi:MAG: DeoR family transcriptional regulator [Oleibacter sp.]|nr:DeoR family transcriptional regulator [Thalassolituus sp.]